MLAKDDGLKIQSFRTQPVIKRVEMEPKEKTRIVDWAFPIAFAVLAVSTLAAAFWG
ncbi:hypothetical protein [Faecalibaculum rodentium]|uniref:hypothetical protein n=1 Tax=Faecalibaculum rodentium TaxID=1702221 RepID=UPI0022BF1D3B|nr:hypothetical protein [Faecalibaculum rodentium]MCZ2807917.1 hypothetical protein [Candidatus Bathyarchaeota archaeon]